MQSQIAASSINQEEKINQILKNRAFKIIQKQSHGIIEKTINEIIRPPRFIYRLANLQPKFDLQLQFKHVVYQIPFPLSVYERRSSKSNTIVLYCHGNSSCRLQGSLKLTSLPKDYSLACFDFNGCGRRCQSDYITLGNKEKNQIKIAVQFLEKKGYYVVGWGHSMGATSLLLSGACQIIVADSPFSDFRQLCRSIGQTKVHKACWCCYQCLFPCAFAFLKRKIYSITETDISELNVVSYFGQGSSNIKTKHLLLIRAIKDNLIPQQQHQEIYETFPYEKKFIKFQGTHNQVRPQAMNKVCYEYIEEVISNRNSMKQIKLSNEKNGYTLQLTQQNLETQGISCNIGKASKKTLPEFDYYCP